MIGDPDGVRGVMEDLIATEIGRLVREADVAVFVHYADAELSGGPIDFDLVERSGETGPLDLRVDFDFVGIGIWFLCQRSGETFRMRHVVVEIDANGRFLRGQVGEQQGYWEDFPKYVTDDRLVGNVVGAMAA